MGKKSVAWRAKKVGYGEHKGMKVGRCEHQKLPESTDISTAARQVDGEAPTPKLSPHLSPGQPSGPGRPTPLTCAFVHQGSPLRGGLETQAGLCLLLPAEMPTVGPLSGRKRKKGRK